MVWVLVVVGSVAFGVVWWLALHVYREVLRRRRVARVRVVLEPRATVTGLWKRCGADELPCPPSSTPVEAAVDRALTVTVGPHAGVTGAAR
ncbi:hypothetical protein [Saccharothrix stipae]